MSVTSATAPAQPVPTASRRVRARDAFASSVALALVAAVALGAGAAVGYRAAYQGRVLPGVHVGTVDVSGLDAAGAAAALEAGYGHLREGRVVLAAGSAAATIPYAEAGRGPDVPPMVAAALAVGRDGDELRQVVVMAHVAVEGVTLEPRLALDAAALDAAVVRALAPLERRPVDATITMGRRGPVTTRAKAGTDVDVPAAQAAAEAAAGRLDAPAEVRIEVPVTAVPAARGDDVVAVARDAAARMIAPLVIAAGDRTWTISARRVQGWLGFEDGPEGSVHPVLHRDRIAPVLRNVAAAVKRKPASATFLVAKGGKVVGVRAGHDGRRLDTSATVSAIVAELGRRRSGEAPATVKAVTAAVPPKLTTAEATKVAPLMTLLGSWTTKFPIGDRNYWGANIWLPARYIDGTLLRPGQRFEWFSAVGPITSARGFGPGGVIRGTYSDPTGAMGGGMCSASTTLFNAALRAGLAMGARANHTYYIDRYPLGLDATVWAEPWGGLQSMTFTNDLPTPILIRGVNAGRAGGSGFVRFEIWGIPDGRRVTVGGPVVRNVVPATTVTRETTTLPPGVREQKEWAAQGMDVWVTRVVRDASGRVIHRDTWYSHYRKWDGLILVGAR